IKSSAQIRPVVGRPTSLASKQHYVCREVRVIESPHPVPLPEGEGTLHEKGGIWIEACCTDTGSRATPASTHDGRRAAAMVEDPRSAARRREVPPPGTNRQVLRRFLLC